MKFIFNIRLVLACSLLYLTAANAQTEAPITAATALQRYLNNGDSSFHYQLQDSYQLGTVKAYAYLLVSQEWRKIVWTHQLTLFVPAENKYDAALLFITGGSNKEGKPNWEGRTDAFMTSMSELATKNKAIVAVLRQTPNQPLFDDLTEDALISYTLHHFKNDHDYSWPLLFPMVKSAVRAMDAVQEISNTSLHHNLNRFVVSGASKRGWTTWLTGASDKRVVAIAPMVIDILNMAVNLDYQMKAWNQYSVEIDDYVKLGIPQTAHTPDGQDLNTMIDPYSYRKALTIPKMIFMGTNDEYWVVDAIKNYYDSLPGRNMIHYVPNVGHDLGDKKSALEGLSAFFGLTCAKQSYPECKWTVRPGKKSATISVTATAASLVGAVVWSAHSANMKFTQATWTSRTTTSNQTSVFTFSEPYPAKGFKAFYLDLIYRDTNGGEYTQSTRMFVADPHALQLH
jgi:PhoPQ-activated pathogenicity-related protein